MEFKELDAMFEGALQRLETGSRPGSPYGEAPLASDHFLLRRSWDYFRKRASSMESEWRQILDAKDAEIRALKELLKLRDARISELEESDTDTEKIEEQFARSQLSEQRGFSDAARKLSETWEEERESLVRVAEEAAVRVERNRKEAEARLEAGKKEFDFLKGALERARTEAAQQAEKRFAADAQAAAALAGRDEHIRSLESKVDLLRSELERRESACKDYVLQLSDLKAENAAALKAAESLSTEMSLKEERLRLADERLESAKRDLEAVRAGWKREQSEWRELWERSRELWEKKERGKANSSTENAS